jgi:hypothetical protein
MRRILSNLAEVLISLRVLARPTQKDGIHLCRKQCDATGVVKSSAPYDN